MVEIRAAAMTLLGITSHISVANPQDIAFAAGGAALMEALKVGRGARDYEPHEAPDKIDLDSPKFLVGIPLHFDPLMEPDKLSLVVAGRAIADAKILVTEGSLSAAQGLLAPADKATE